ncbi:uncharacterized protein EDB91DRAFT_1251058 [Suillus paluster]|uniref:uncharacterized protein n=1 Tax=Suillus paluster TaxID=48578 RepID=UPI001B885629|nr:uncharacterized protein EDB91DRAFT_1251058 [Suillus paluster]KAG1734268.1 hypothetical protein EDB91DRAFT_1251058 [Suillus paluster]
MTDSLEEISVPAFNTAKRVNSPHHLPQQQYSDLEDSESDLDDIVTDDIDVDDSISAFEWPAIKQEPEDVHMEYSRSSAKKKGSQTTSSTFVTTTDIKPPPSKKIKTEQANSHNTPLTAKATEDRTWVERSKARNFGSTAIAIIIDFLSRNEDEDVEELAKYLLAKYTFLYKDTELLDKATIYCSPFMLQLVGTAHLQATISHADVPELKTSTLAEKGIICVVSICAAALEHALTLISNSDINIEDVLTAAPAQRRLMVKTPKVLNKATRKETWTIHTFSVSNWGSQMLAFSRSVQAKGDMAIKTIASMAWKVLKKSKSGHESFLNEDDSVENDPHAFLW